MQLDHLNMTTLADRLSTIVLHSHPFEIVKVLKTSNSSQFYVMFKFHGIEFICVRVLLTYV